MTTHSLTSAREWRRGALLAAMILGVSIAAKVAVAIGFWPSTDLSERAAMAMSGVALVILGNAIPKTLTPLASQRCAPATMQRLQRLAGWTWVATGVVLTLVWLVAPIGLADTATLIGVPAAMLVNIVQIVRVRRGGTART